MKWESILRLIGALLIFIVAIPFFSLGALVAGNLGHPADLGDAVVGAVLSAIGFGICFVSYRIARAADSTLEKVFARLVYAALVGYLLLGTDVLLHKHIEGQSDYTYTYSVSDDGKHMTRSNAPVKSSKWGIRYDELPYFLYVLTFVIVAANRFQKQRLAPSKRGTEFER